MKEAQAAYLTALSLIDGLVEAGLRYLVASPGYRNSPLLLAAHRHAKLKVLTAVDERGAAFLALGLNKAGAPAAVACTSGTAAGNYLPAVMEAFHSHAPLLVITADRPPELVGTGANQCADQTKIFGSFAREFIEIPCSGPSEEHASYAAAKAMARTQSPIPGPVHLNVRFREPFLPEAAAVEAAEKERKNGKAKWLFLPSASGPSKEQWEAVEKMFEAAKRPLILVGPSGFSASTLESLRKLSHHTGYPVLAENASGLPFRGGDRAFVSRQLEATLGAIREGALEAPDLLVRAGAPITGRALERLLASHPIPQILFDETGEGREPHLYPSICVQGGLKGWISAFLRSSLSLRDEAWRDSLLAFGKKREERLKDHLIEGELTEWHFHHELGAKLGEGSVVFLGNSMPVRDFNDVFAAEKLLHVFTNRGLSGIDGLLASAAGVALGSGRETHALIGDLSTLHDLSSLSILSSLREEISLTLWVLNNGGGEIFRIVPTAKTAGEAEWFTTPQEYDLASLAKAFRLPFARLSTLAALQELDPSACSGNGVRVIEILANRETNLATRRGFGEK